MPVDISQFAPPAKTEPVDIGQFAPPDVDISQFAPPAEKTAHDKTTASAAVLGIDTPGVREALQRMGENPGPEHPAVVLDPSKAHRSEKWTPGRSVPAALPLSTDPVKAGNGSRRGPWPALPSGSP